MFDKIENFYLDIVRFTLLLTASFALIIAIFCAYKGYSVQKPYVNPMYTNDWKVFQNNTDPINYFKRFVPDDDFKFLKDKYKPVTSSFEDSSYDENSSVKINEEFLKVIFGREYNAKGYERELNAALSNVEWKSIHSNDKTLQGANSLTWRTYGNFNKNLEQLTKLLVEKHSNKTPVFSDSKFDAVFATVGSPSRWFATEMRDTFSELSKKYSEEKSEYEIEKALLVPYLIASSVSFFYFLLVMFYVVFTKIERNLRVISENSIK